MMPWLIAFAIVFSGLQAAPLSRGDCGDAKAKVSAAVIHTEDVARFYRVYRGADGHPTVEQLQNDYLNPGSDGLHRLAKLRNVTGERIAANLRENPEMYSDARRCMAVLPQVRGRLLVSFGKLARLYPEAKFPPVTIVVGRGKPVGVADESGVMIGLEALCATNWMNPSVEDRFVHVIAHEYVHVQQALAAPAFYNETKPTVLQASLIEGAADFIGELISGDVANSNLTISTRGHETEIGTAFAADENKTDLSKWLYNGTLVKPGDIGYWVGYRITKSYYQHAADKCRSVREIIQMNDAQEFLARSGWKPGIRLK
jgi:hypothetical protein